ncbi:MAG: hypothetical protein V2I43_02160 [Parvularcula sp.]|jgi:hypothetical protein|nr:hypothetical protein [Parvularcula sp.]
MTSAVGLRTGSRSSEQAIDFKLRTLTANLIRIVRGGGTPYDVEGQVMELAREFQGHRELTSHGVSPHVIDAALCIRPEIERRDHPHREMQDAEASVVKGALQLAAATLLNQNTFKATGGAEMLSGQQRWEELRDFTRR